MELGQNATLRALRITSLIALTILGCDALSGARAERMWP